MNYGWKFGFYLRVCVCVGWGGGGNVEIFEVLNVCILNSKYYINNKRLLKLLYDTNIEFSHVLHVLKFKLNIEHNIM